ncbi:MAG TPA: AmmeMemoRadiSam system protein A [Candidatus Koribacter sp.]|jgi:AmmeMemoRadiSam system protein A
MSQLPSQSGTSAASEYSPTEREILLQLAHRAIHARLQRTELDLRAPTTHLAQERGAFTTLHRNGNLRGCIGYVLPVASLYRTIAETATAAAFDDPRFEPVTPAEVPDLKVEISVMSPLFPIRPEEIEIGKHGLLVTLDRHRGLLLPQVPVEHEWDRETFLSETCRKAWLPPDAWRHGVQLEAFTAEVFSE